MTTRKHRKSLLITLGAVFLLVGVFFVTRPKPLLTFSLADGTQITIASIEVGTNFHMFHGSSMQESAFRLVGTRLSPRFVGSESTIPASLPGAGGTSLGMVLKRFSPRSFVGTPWNGNQSLTMLDDSGKETAGLQRLVHFDTGVVNEKTKVTSEQILWEFPTQPGLQLTFRLYDTNATTGTVLTNQFAVPNPISSR